MKTEAGGSQNAIRKICWLASFPKSGNTWTRILLSHLVGEKPSDSELDYVQLNGSISSNRVRFDNLTGLPSSDMTDDEIDILRPATYRSIAKDSSERLYVKVHDAYHENAQGNPIFPADCSYGVIYLVRNPLDVAVSYAFHQGHQDFAKTVAQLNCADHIMAGGPRSQLRQKTFGWAGHYKSWHQQTEIPVLTIRYEDMLEDTEACVMQMAKFLQLESDDMAERVAHAVAESHFDKLREKEARIGFQERPQKAERFFRSGRAGEGREQLSSELQNEIYNVNHELMRKLGYAK
ncbi:sulfotransferase domain-containing protein [Sphingorhabdus sp. Alg239-R122]|uniref:sulfotransferase domain-containing protein n=1 Tax=Sphingorhabdus sp. Alg239-R122 TaxID=2305989 RepID=UPI0013D9FB31|nr:sulfotransferase domain-containing protein [Sphingorhabdus sp. Alg239-R122]